VAYFTLEGKVVSLTILPWVVHLFGCKILGVDFVAGESLTGETNIIPQGNHRGNNGVIDYKTSVILLSFIVKPSRTAI